MTTLLPYELNAPDIVANGVLTPLFDTGRLFLVYDRLQGWAQAPYVYQVEADQAGDGTYSYDSPFGPSGPFSPTSVQLPNSDTGGAQVVFLRWLVSTGPAWPFGLDAAGLLQMATLARSELPTGWHEALIYGAFSFGALNPALPITSFTARPTSSVSLDMRVSLDGGGP